MKKIKPVKVIMLLLAICMAFTMLPLTGLAAADTDITADFTDAKFLDLIRMWTGKTNGEPIYDSDVNTMTYLSLHNRGITSLNGIQHFSALQMLDCSVNQITTLDLSTLNQLNYLSCSNNQLMILNLSGLSSLKYLICLDNQLTTLNLNTLGQLEYLYCYDNQLRTLNLNGLSQLKELHCYGNQLTTLNLNGLSQLEKLVCYSNQLTTLDLSSLSQLNSLECYGNQLTTLNLSGLNQLSYLNCGLNQLTSITGLPPSLTSLNCEQNRLTSLDVTGVNLSHLYCPYNWMTTPADVTGFTGIWDAAGGYAHSFSPQHTNQFKAVTSIIGVPKEIPVNTTIALAATVIPDDAEYKNITWGIVVDSGTGAVLNGNLLTASNPGVMWLEGKVTDGFAPGSNYGKWTLIHVRSSHTVTASAGLGGSISPTGETVVISGRDQTFTITANPTYEIADVRVDGASVGAVSSYTFQSITANHTIEATFKVAPLSHTITASATKGGSISPTGETAVLDGSDQTFTITAKPKYEIADVRVDGASVGAVDSYTFQNITANHTIAASFKIINPFTDVTTTDWFYDDVLDVYIQDLMIGTAPDKFSPTHPMTRAMAVTALYRSSGETATTDNIFRDVPADTWYEEAAAWGAANNIVLGVGNQKFDPMANVTREQMATFLYRYAQYKGKDVTSADTKFNAFNDNTKASEYALPALAWACENELLKGYGNSTLSPQSFITRAENAALLQRFMAMP